MTKVPEGATHKLLDKEGLMINYVKIENEKFKFYFVNMYDENEGHWLSPKTSQMLKGRTLEALPQPEDNITAMRRKAFEMGYREGFQVGLKNHTEPFDVDGAIDKYMGNSK